MKTREFFKTFMLAFGAVSVMVTILICCPIQLTGGAPIPPQADGEPSAPQKPLTIPLKSLPFAVVGYWYSERISVEGGKLPYDFSVTGAPDGFMFRNFTDRLSGQGVAPGEYSITVTVADSTEPKPLTTSSTFKLKIVAAPSGTQKK